MERFYCRMRFSATIYNNNWVCADNLAPYGQGARTDLCLTDAQEKRFILLQPAPPAAQAFDQKLLKQRNNSFKTFPELVIKLEYVPKDILKYNNH